MASNGKMFQAPVDSDLTPGEGWHCSHFFYAFDRATIFELDSYERGSAIESLEDIFVFNSVDPVMRIQSGLCVGHKADWSLMMMDPDPFKIEAIHQAIMSSEIGQAIECVDSYVSLTEISEYVMTVEQFRDHLVQTGLDPGSAEFEKRVTGYAGRLPAMNKQRLTPEFPPWPVSCFYPMNKQRVIGANWFTEPFSIRQQMMGEHAQSGMKYAGKVTQLITSSVGLDDWEWGVTLWATNPIFLKQIVYEMRFDRASAQYAEFGSFYTSYLMQPREVFKRCRVI
jgi:hydrogen peroxide-dependent heme synthase